MSKPADVERLVATAEETFWGSVNSMVAEPDIAAYSASKGAVLMLTKSVAVEYAKDNIRANCLCPGGVRTPMVAGFFDEEFLKDEQAQRAYQPLGLISPEEVADVAVFLVSDESRKMTGSAVMVDAGYRPSEQMSHLGTVGAALAA
ncbi:NAD(P)-dependent dehydrogenase (short-subunit alcohol dehydrogenase family) [Arthrobacter sp. 1088]|uniref:SDR family oxidoreductase n=1 Tax=unclassified Arthrobacter TaxID=235627 RepID=UPI001CC6357E|nr:MULTISPECIES: SDR family oxidoreductase [unclassified Arthrobacter]MDR6685432.1 NAD(P)-dependent dehydrogenase (short-subunit alcohol dehydrogenase family) [Arthrobacter sp. 1088]